jgi:hypothetical protein
MFLDRNNAASGTACESCMPAHGIGVDVFDCCGLHSALRSRQTMSRHQPKKRCAIKTEGRPPHVQPADDAKLALPINGSVVQGGIQVALETCRTTCAGNAGIVLRFNSFDNDGSRAHFRKVNQLRQTRRRCRIGTALCDQRTIELHDVDTETEEIAQAAEVMTYVIERNTATQRSER